MKKFFRHVFELGPFWLSALLIAVSNWMARQDGMSLEYQIGQAMFLSVIMLPASFLIWLHRPR